MARPLRRRGWPAAAKWHRAASCLSQGCRGLWLTHKYTADQAAAPHSGLMGRRHCGGKPAARHSTRPMLRCLQAPSLAHQWRLAQPAARGTTS